MAMVVHEREVTAERAGRLDRVVQELTGRSRSEVRGLFDHGCVKLNGTDCTEPGTPVKAGDGVTVRHDPHTRYRERPRVRDSRSLRLVFEDADLIVVDKDAYQLTVPTSRGETSTLIDAVNRHIARKNPRARATAIHRLDRGTSGLLVFAKTQRFKHELRNQFRTHDVLREYVAIVAGTIDNEAGTFESRLATTKSLQRYSVRPGQTGKRAVTHFRVERRLREATLVRAWLETGRRNQVRVHFAESGHPVLGDQRYEPHLARHRHWTARRMALHAAVLGFKHPATGEPLRFESPLPEEFTRFLSPRL
jgi:23S rRNA pseudouridine1911/1915/1917 synthase